MTLMNKSIISIFEESPDIVYIVDMAKKEVRYLNKEGRRVFGFSSPEEVVGRKCYEALRGFRDVCSDCKIPKSHLYQYHVWTTTNPITKNYYSVRQTVFEDDGRYYQLSICVYQGYEKYQLRTMVQMMAVERIINAAEEKALECDHSEVAINTLLQYLGDNLESDRVYIFEEAPDGTCSNTYEWCADGVTAEINNLQNLPNSVLRMWYDEFDKNKNILIRDMEEYKQVCRPIYDILKPQNIDTLVVGPLSLNGRRIGFYGVDNPPYNNMDYISSSYELLGNFISSLLRSRNCEKGHR